MAAVVIYKEKLYLIDEKITTIQADQVRKYPLGARVPIKDLIALTFVFPKSLDEERLGLEVELRMYNEGGLDLAQAYEIHYIKYPHQFKDEWVVEAFAIPQKLLQERFNETVQKIGFIDCLYPKFITYTAAYDEHHASTDVIFYLGEEESFGAIYQNGHYIGHRALDSLKEISKKLGMELLRLKSLLISKGLVLDGDEDRIGSIREIFLENVQKIVQAINYKANFFPLERIDRIVIDFEGQNIPGLGEVFKEFGIQGELKEVPFSCCGFGPKESSLAVEARYIQRCEPLNFSIFPRPKPLGGYFVTRLAMVAAIALAAMGAGYWYLVGKLERMQEQIAYKRALIAKIDQQSRAKLKELKKLQERHKQLQEQLRLLYESKVALEDTIDAVPLIEHAKEVRQKMMNDVVEALSRHRLKTSSIDQNGSKEVVVRLLSKDRQKEAIAKFMEDLIQKGYKDVHTSKIEEREGLYQSEVRVRR
ncbi:MAG: hypothetical protein C6H99_01990 [Epsilonproteobacteria bacterium]|nr:hypothetical protein [Campylobacterota bacterium]NPA63853.1 hypothetical protein [Campylobacterota bacterium]